MFSTKRASLLLSAFALAFLLIQNTGIRNMDPLGDLWRQSADEQYNVTCGMVCASSRLDCGHDCIPGNSHFFRMQEACGPLCHTAVNAPATVTKPGRFFDELRKPVDCEALLTSPDVDVGQETAHPPRLSAISSHLQRAYSYGNRVPIETYYWDQRQYGQTFAAEWTSALIEDLVVRARRRILEGNYGLSETNCLADGVKHVDVNGKHVLVIGSQTPWVEAVCLANGARKVTTLEYASTTSTDPRISTMTPEDMRKLALRKELPIFDAVVTFSSLEHSGLGRYGDALNPWGDIISLAKAHCITKTNGSLVLAVMTADSLGGIHGRERIRWNADRIYGEVMYPHLAANWQQNSAHCGINRVFTFQKAELLRKQP